MVSRRLWASVEPAGEHSFGSLWTPFRPPRPQNGRPLHVSLWLRSLVFSKLGTFLECMVSVWSHHSSGGSLLVQVYLTLLGSPSPP